MRMIPLSVFAQKMHVAYMTAWKSYTRGWLKGSHHGENGITVPENLLPNKIDDAIEVVNLAEYNRRKGAAYHQARLNFMDGKIHDSFRNSVGPLKVLIFEKEESIE